MKRIKNFLNWVNEEYNPSHDVYAGEHEAPTKDSGAPLYNVSGIYPDDIYSSDALRMYGSGNEDGTDIESINIIQSCKGRPNKGVKIYRAVPDFNKDITKQLKELYYILSYRDRYPFFPPKNNLVKDLENKYPVGDEYSYDEQQKLVLQDLKNKVEELEKDKIKSIKINAGDWVTISKRYAIQHGRDNLRNSYKIISKTVPAKTLYTDGNDVNEWGYSPDTI